MLILIAYIFQLVLFYFNNQHLPKLQGTFSSVFFLSLLIFASSHLQHGPHSLGVARASAGIVDLVFKIKHGTTNKHFFNVLLLDAFHQSRCYFLLEEQSSPVFFCLFVFRCESISITVLSLIFLESQSSQQGSSHLHHRPFFTFFFCYTENEALKSNIMIMNADLKKS